ncbi:MAG: hypothetical protein K9G40_09265 [Crocinitomicaceae bacterium]|jgi:hypothetical protein|nr:hypothetical protein [Crocinitomicaceae bacterium]MCF8435003.1 hypothetical protein [Crocinitomicaceae bacterium]
MASKWRNYGLWHNSVYPKVPFEVMEETLKTVFHRRGEIKVKSISCTSGRIYAVKFMEDGKDVHLVIKWKADE